MLMSMSDSVCYIVGASDFSETFAVSDGDLVIAADGGYDSLLGVGITPDVLIGDLESVKSIPEGTEIIRHPVEKDDTDSHLAYKHGYSRGYRKFVLFGGTGGRLDHTLANISLLLRAKLDGADMRMIGGGAEMRVIKNESVTLTGRAGSTVSVFAVGGAAHGVSIVGLKYRAEDVTLTEDYALGVSNSFTETGTGEVSVANGALLIITECDF